MLRIGIISDLHQDFASNQYDHIPNNCDVMIIAGDLQEGCGVQSLIPYVAAGQRVIYVAGNHEHYDHEISNTFKQIEQEAADHGIDFLNENTVTINNVRFIGATLWTDFLLYGEGMEYGVREACHNGMNDYFCITNKEHPLGTFTPNHARNLHTSNKAYLNKTLLEPHDGPTVVVTHHAPSAISVPDYYKDDLISAGYASNLENFIMQHNPNVWVHGHTHRQLDYMIADTRVVCNARGYNFEHTGNYEPYIIEL